MEGDRGSGEGSGIIFGMKRSFKYISKKLAAGGDFGANSLGSVQPEKKDGYLDRFSCTPRKAHQHAWLYGEVNKVCSVCGLTQLKDT